MNLERTLELSRHGQLYPAVIVHGGDAAARQRATVELARTLLCDSPAAARPCGNCRHCRRIDWPGESERFHPDFTVLQRDLKTSTSAEATRAFVTNAWLAPFEARGQVFVIAAAESLSAEAADALLKAIEEPATATGRHFFLLAPNVRDLPPTLRSRSFALYLGAATPLSETEIAESAAMFGSCAARLAAGEGGIWLLGAAAALARIGGWEEPRATRPWELAAAAVARAAGEEMLPAPRRRALLALAEELLAAAPWRLRGISAERLLEGLVARHLGAAR